jgi:ring-1,2-phenylacetyl-CoA epoxidase subunit PaaD
MCGAEVVSRVDAAWRVLREVPDPELPAVSLVDLGIVRRVEPASDGGPLRVVLTPTYTGCPATEAISAAVRESLDGAGLGPVEVLLERSPAWTTDWITDDGRRKLHDHGIAPPGRCGAGGVQPLRFHAPPPVDCPRCGSARTRRLSAFGSTPCKSLYRCLDCAEPFEHLKAL